MNGLNKALNETTNLVKNAAAYVHFSFSVEQCCTRFSEQLLSKMLLPLIQDLSTLSHYVNVRKADIIVTLFKATGIDNYCAHFHFTIVIILTKTIDCQTLVLHWSVHE